MLANQTDMTKSIIPSAELIALCCLWEEENNLVCLYNAYFFKQQKPSQQISS